MEDKRKCRKCEKEFLMIATELRFYEKKGLWLPEECSECRRQDRRGMRNERKLYTRKCDKCEIDLTSSYPAEAEFEVLCEKCYHGAVN